MLVTFLRAGAEAVQEEDGRRFGDRHQRAILPHRKRHSFSVPFGVGGLPPALQHLFLSGHVDEASCAV